MGELAKREVGALGAPIPTAEDIEVARNTVAAGATDAEFRLFLHDCQRQSVHPLDRLIHFTIRTDKRGVRRYTPITSIDLFRARADISGDYAGNEDPMFEPPQGRPNMATVSVYRMVKGVRCAFTATARWDEYYPGDGKEGFMWRKMPHVMLGKTAEALALRKAFPRQLHGIYIKEEMEQADAPEMDTPAPAQAKPLPEPEPQQTPAAAIPPDTVHTRGCASERMDSETQGHMRGEVIDIRTDESVQHEGVPLHLITMAPPGAISKPGKLPKMHATYGTFDKQFVELAQVAEGQVQTLLCLFRITKSGNRQIIDLDYAQQTSKALFDGSTRSAGPQRDGWID